MPTRKHSRKAKKIKNSRKRPTGTFKKISRPDVVEMKIPKTNKIASKQSMSRERIRESTAKSNMRMTDLQIMAKSLGIPFGGKSKDRLIRDINKYK